MAEYKDDKAKQDKLFEKKGRKPASTFEKEQAKKKARRKAMKKMIKGDMQDILKSMSKKAIAAEGLGDEKEAERLYRKIEKLKKMNKDEIKSSSFLTDKEKR